MVFRSTLVALVLGSTLAVTATAQVAQSGTAAKGGVEISRSSGFFAGLGFEGDGLATSGNPTESGGGAGLILGYGFNRTWSLYTEFSGATMNSSDNSGSYKLGHFDLGTRIHFRSGENTVVPFIQAALAGRAMSQTVNGTDVSANGAGVSVGGGLNVHFSPSTAFSASVTWGFGKFDNVSVGNVTVTNVGQDATTARVHVGLVWFP